MQARFIREALRLYQHGHLEPRVQGLQPATASRRPFSILRSSALLYKFNPMPLQSFRAQQRCMIRQTVRQRRSGLTVTQQQHDALQLSERLILHPRIDQAHSIGLFLSFDGEIETKPLIQRLWNRGKDVYLPVLHPVNPGTLLFLRYTADTSLVINRFNIPEPELDVRLILPVNQLEILFTPLVAFDHHGKRLGMGGGFYDRTLQNWQQHGPYPIGLAYDCQQVDEIPTEHWDIPLPEIITPSRTWIWDPLTKEPS